MITTPLNFSVLLKKLALVSVASNWLKKPKKEAL